MLRCQLGIARRESPWCFLMRTPRLLEDRTGGGVSIFLPIFTAPSDAAKFCGFVSFTSLNPIFTVSIRAFDLVIFSVSVFI